MTPHARPAAYEIRDPWIAATTAQREAARRLAKDFLGNRQVWLVSNRGPVEYCQHAGSLSCRSGQGGLATALRAFGQVTPVNWVACAMNVIDAQVARQHGGWIELPDMPGPVKLSFVTPSRREYEGYYDAIANSVLWLLQHHVNHAPTHPTFDESLWQAWQEGYQRVNQLFAQHIQAAVNQSGHAPVFLLQDYHLYLLPGLLRARFPAAPILHFTHIPWPGPETWRQLPKTIRTEIFTHLLGADVVGFHAPQFVNNFLNGCDELLGLPVDRQKARVQFAGRWVRVRAYPISVDPVALAELAKSPRILNAESQLLRKPQEKLVVMIARTDPSKNLLRTLHAYEDFLERFPTWHARVRLVALLPLSRQSTDIYKEYTEDLRQLIQRVNAAWSKGSWRPVELLLQHDYEQAIALLKQYDVLLVNSLADGMNLVAKEGPLLNQRAGALVLSETAGACAELGQACRVVNPFDLSDVSAALHEVLTAHPNERRWAQDAQRDIIAEQTIFRWVHDQLADILLPEQLSLGLEITPLGNRVPTPD
jgi:trehalose 6-phosphate synthase